MHRVCSPKSANISTDSFSGLTTYCGPPLVKKEKIGMLLPTTDNIHLMIMLCCHAVCVLRFVLVNFDTWKFISAFYTQHAVAKPLFV